MGGKARSSGHALPQNKVAAVKPFTTQSFVRFFCLFMSGTIVCVCFFAKHVVAAKQEYDAIVDPSLPYDKFHRDMLLKGCGGICKTPSTGSPRVQHSTGGDVLSFPEVRKRVDCHGLFTDGYGDATARIWPPPSTIPDALRDDFTMGGSAKVFPWFLENRYSGGSALTNVWTTKMIDGMIAMAEKSELHGTYGTSVTTEVKSFLWESNASIRGKRMYVVGSENPWLEALLLHVGAAHVTTIEYGEIRSEDARIATMTPFAAAQRFAESNGLEPQFDGGATFSSLEHSGLGRYGDILNPWGDMQAVAKAWCMTQPGGLLFIGVPSSSQDRLYWNAHREYGPLRLPQMMANWRYTGSSHPPFSAPQDYKFDQPLMAFKRLAQPE